MFDKAACQHHLFDHLVNVLENWLLYCLERNGNSENKKKLNVIVTLRQSSRAGSEKK